MKCLNCGKDIEKDKPHKCYPNRYIRIVRKNKKG